LNFRQQIGTQTATTWDETTFFGQGINRKQLTIISSHMKMMTLMMSLPATKVSVRVYRVNDRPPLHMVTMTHFVPKPPPLPVYTESQSSAAPAIHLVMFLLGQLQWRVRCTTHGITGLVAERVTDLCACSSIPDIVPYTAPTILL
jgi:hypothetical protein